MAASCTSFRPQHRFSYHRAAGHEAVASVPAAAAAHKSASIPCKFWLQGRCNRGDSCRFSHNNDASTPAPPSTRSRNLSWIRPISSSHDDDQHEASNSETHGLAMEVEEESAGVAPVRPPVTISSPPLVTIAATTAPPVPPPVTIAATTAPVPPPVAIAAAAAPVPPPVTIAAADATGVSSVTWPTLVVTSADGSICVEDAERLHINMRVHRLHAPITCVVDGPVQQLLHPGLLVFGLASGEIGMVSFSKEQEVDIHIVDGPSQSCGKVLSIVTARTPSHPLVIIAGYENGAILCWSRAPHDDASFTPLCALQYPTATSVVSMAISYIQEGQKQLLYSASADGSICMWDLGTFTRLQVLRPKQQPEAVPITKLITARRYFFCGYADGSIQAWGPASASAPNNSEMELLYTHASPRKGGSGGSERPIYARREAHAVCCLQRRYCEHVGAADVQGVGRDAGAIWHQGHGRGGIHLWASAIAGGDWRRRPVRAHPPSKLT